MLTFFLCGFLNPKYLNCQHFDYSNIVFSRAYLYTTLKTCVAGIHKYLLTDNASYQLT